MKPVAVLGVKSMVFVILLVMFDGILSADRWTFSLRRSGGSGPLCMSLLPPPSDPLS